jgi:hypothetical protein
MSTSAPLPKRTWVYLLSPNQFQMAGCPCGNEHPNWSEFENHLWCDYCQKDFIPQHNGIFDGPIPIHTAGLLGIHFNRVNLLTNKFEVFDPDTNTYHEEESPAKNA